MLKKLKSYFEMKSLEKQMKYQLLSRFYLLVEELASVIDDNKQKKEDSSGAETNHE